MITKLKVENFKSIGENCNPIEFKPLTIFVGWNASGKSNILESLCVLAQATKMQERTLNKSLLNGEFFKYPEPYTDFISNKRDKNKWISIEIHIKPNESEDKEFLADYSYPSSIDSIGYKYSYLPKDNSVIQSLFINDEKLIEVEYVNNIKKFTFPKEFERLFPGDDIRSILNRYIFTYSVPDDYDIGGKKEYLDSISSLASKMVEIIEKKLSNVYFISALRGGLPLVEPTAGTGGPPTWVGKDGEKLIELLSLIFGKREYEEKASKIVKWSEKFGISKIKAGWWGGNILGSDYLDPELKTSLNLILSSQGSRQVLTLITQLFWSHPESIILIEEPEISLHPESQIELQKMFAEVIKDGKQVIYTTHSTFLLLALSELVRENLLQADSIAVYHVEKDEKGTSVKPLSINEQGYIEGWIPSYLKVEEELFGNWVESLEEV
ncbi:MAG: AAA family ATPase [Methanosarcinales archaeon]